MDQHPMDWAYSQTLKPSTKFVLVTMAKVARPEYFCAVSTLCGLTNLDRKTVFSAINDLLTLRLISDTGKRVGKTGRVVVYELCMPVDNLWITTLQSSQNRNDSKTGIVPLSPGNRPKNGILSNRPKNGIVNKDIKIEKENRRVSRKESQNIPTNRPRSMTEIMEGLKIATRGKV